jgi:hypothetical protein
LVELMTSLALAMSRGRSEEVWRQIASIDGVI